MRDDLKSIPTLRPTFTLTVADKKKIVAEAIGLLLIIVLGISTFLLLAMMYETPVPPNIQTIQTSGEVMSK